jgi:ABC-type transport system substrate-binding protein/ABC-type dipeptide/oligopeptide/nickel transport system permease subunit
VSATVRRRKATGLLGRVLASTDGKVGAVLLGALVVGALVLPVILGDPNASDWDAARAAGGTPVPAGGAHPLGTDVLARDELARLAGGARVSLAIAGAASLVASVLGVLVGVSAATLAERPRTRWIDSLLMRGVDVLLAMPFLLTVTTLGVLVGRTDATTMVVVLGVTGWTGLARVVRARAASVLSQDYVLAARALGASERQIAARHVLPNVLPTAAVLATGLVGAMILAEAVLGYLGVGIQPPTSSWGRMLHEAETLVSLSPHLVALPAACIVAATLAFHRLGDALVTATGGREAHALGRGLPLDVILAAALVAMFVAMPASRPAGPDPGARATETPTRGGTLHLATFYTVRTLDPAVATDELSLAMGRMVFGRLVAFDEHGERAPALASDFWWSSDRRTLELRLTRGARFQDGAPLRAEDVKRSLERALNPASGSPGASNFEGLVGFSDFRDGKALDLRGVRVVSPEVVAFDLVEPDASLPARLSLSFVAPVCPSVRTLPKDTRDVELCGAGPFRIDAFEPEARLRLVRNEAYLDPALPYLDAIELEFHVRPQTQRYRFERGEIDLVRELAASDAAWLRSDARWLALSNFVESQRISAIFLNTESGPFRSRALRRAVSLAIDPEVLRLVRPDVVPLERVVPPSIPGLARPTTVRRHDLGAALAAMEEAGYPFDPRTGRGGYPEPIDYVAVPDSFEQQAAEVYAQQLAKVGLRVRLRLLSFQSYLDEVQHRGRTQMGWAGWQADYPDPLTFFEPNLVSSSIGEVTQNYSLYANPELDALIAETKRETDPAKRARLFADAESRVLEDAAWVPTYSPRVFEVRQPWLGGYRPTPLTTLDFERAFIAPRSTPASALAPLGAQRMFGAARGSR